MCHLVKPTVEATEMDRSQVLVLASEQRREGVGPPDQQRSGIAATVVLSAGNLKASISPLRSCTALARGQPATRATYCSLGELR